MHPYQPADIVVMVARELAGRVMKRAAIFAVGVGVWWL
jgi:hypothetical protein